MRITDLIVYPIKSFPGISVSRVRVTSRGFERDRRWMIADDEGRSLTQRNHPELTGLSLLVEGESIICTTPEGKKARLPLVPSSGPAASVVLWRDRIAALKGPDAASEWLSDFLHRRASFVFMPEAVHRPVDARYGRAGDIVSFADGYPLLMTTVESLEDLNQRLVRRIPMDRFRPNLVISGVSPWVEESWRHVSTDGIRFRVVKACPRCVVITTDQRSGARDNEPLRSLAEYRLVEGKACFGMNLVPDTSGELSVGQTLRSG